MQFDCGSIIFGILNARCRRWHHDSWEIIINVGWFTCKLLNRRWCQLWEKIGLLVAFIATTNFLRRLKYLQIAKACVRVRVFNRDVLWIWYIRVWTFNFYIFLIRFIRVWTFNFCILWCSRVWTFSFCMLLVRYIGVGNFYFYSFLTMCIGCWF